MLARHKQAQQLHNSLNYSQSHIIYEEVVMWAGIVLELPNLLCEWIYFRILTAGTGSQIDKCFAYISGLCQQLDNNASS